MASAADPHEAMRGRDVARVARGEQAPRPPHEPGSVADSPPPPPRGSGGMELHTAPCDFRFPTQNQTRHCYVRYLEYHRCVKAKDGDAKSECDKFQRYYRSLCPTDWVVEWNRQRGGRDISRTDLMQTDHVLFRSKPHVLPGDSIDT